MALDIFDFLAQLKRERYRTTILHAAPEEMPALTQLVKLVCERIGGHYLDLSEFFAQNKDLGSNIESFGAARLRGLLFKRSQDGSLLFVDRADFLLAQWGKTERQDFYRMIVNQWDGYKGGTKARLVFCLQTSPEIESLHIVTKNGLNRVNRMADFNDIG